MYRIQLTEDELKMCHTFLDWLDKLGTLRRPVAKSVFEKLSAAHSRMLKGAK